MVYILIGILCISLIFNIFLVVQKRKANYIGPYKNDELEILRIQNENYKNTTDNLRKEIQETSLLSRLVTQSPNAIMLMDKDGDIQMINEGFSNMYEYTFEEFTRALGTNYRQTSFSSDVDYRLKTVAQTKQPYRYEALNITRTGKEIWTQTALVPILDESGNITHLVTIDTDIHDRIIKSDQLVNEMEQLNSRIDDLAKQFKYLENEFTSLFQNISELFRLVQQTGEILAFIKGISDETRILGFNASIEANRAGQHGTGFRVITNEIIEISDRTIQSISQIKKIVDSIKEKQNELMVKRDDSESRMRAYHQLVSILKKEVIEIESSIAEFKSLT